MSNNKKTEKKIEKIEERKYSQKEISQALSRETELCDVMSGKNLRLRKEDDSREWVGAGKRLAYLLARSESGEWPGILKNVVVKKNREKGVEEKAEDKSR